MQQKLLTAMCPLMLHTTLEKKMKVKVKVKVLGAISALYCILRPTPCCSLHQKLQESPVSVAAEPPPSEARHLLWLTLRLKLRFLYAS